MDFVLVHGTTQSASGWQRLADALRARAHHVRTVELPVDQREWTVSDYARETARQAGSTTARRVVVGHSGAGVLLPAIAGPLSAAAAVWLAAYVPDFGGGRNMLEDIQAHRAGMFHADWLGADPTSDPQLALRFLFHDCDQETQQWALPTLRAVQSGPGRLSERARPGPGRRVGERHRARAGPHAAPGVDAPSCPGPPGRRAGRGQRWPLPARVVPGHDRRCPDRAVGRHEYPGLRRDLPLGLAHCPAGSRTAALVAPEPQRRQCGDILCQPSRVLILS